MSLELLKERGEEEYWYLAPVPPNVTSPEMTPFTYVSAAYDMLKVGDKARSLAFLENRVAYMTNVLVKLFLGCQLLLRAKTTTKRGLV